MRKVYSKESKGTNADTNHLYTRMQSLYARKNTLACLLDIISNCGEIPCTWVYLSNGILRMGFCII